MYLAANFCTRVSCNKFSQNYADTLKMTSSLGNCADHERLVSQKPDINNIEKPG